MYHYFEDKETLRERQNCCSKLVKELEYSLREKGIISQAFLVGSGGRNMITQNGNGPIDFDYNLNIISCNFIRDCKKLKETVRIIFNEVLQENGLKNVGDSTSALTTKPIVLDDDDDVTFSIDLAIVTRDTDGNWHRLIHEKTGNTHNDRYYWNIAPNSNGYKEKSKQIKQVAGAWELVRDEYLDIKNFYLSKNDKFHPSFICYIEAVNNVYNQLKQKRYF